MTLKPISAFLKGENRPIVDFICPDPDWVSNILHQPGLRLDMVISTPDLASLDEEMLNMWERGQSAPKDLRFVLRRALEPVLMEYDAIIIDCPPGLSLLSSAAILASDYFVSPIIPEPLALLGIDLVQARIAELRRRLSDVKIQHAGSVLNKVLHWRRAHSEESSLVYGFPAGGRNAYPKDKYRAFAYWVPDAEHLRKLGSFDCELLSEYPILDSTGHFGWVHGKYGGTAVRLRNARAGPLDRSREEGPEYYLSARLEHLTHEFMERIGIS